MLPSAGSRLYISDPLVGLLSPVALLAVALLVSLVPTPSPILIEDCRLFFSLSNLK